MTLTENKIACREFDFGDHGQMEFVAGRGTRSAPVKSYLFKNENAKRGKT
jgi:hypothetical protein